MLVDTLSAIIDNSRSFELEREMKQYHLINMLMYMCATGLINYIEMLIQEMKTHYSGPELVNENYVKYNLTTLFPPVLILITITVLLFYIYHCFFL